MQLDAWKHLTDTWDRADRERERLEEAASVFFETISRNDWEGASKLITRGCSPNMTLGMRTPLMCAAEEGAIECLRLLISTGANLGAQDEIGRDAVFCAIDSGQDNALECLLAQGTRLKRLFEDNATPLIKASLNGNVRAVRALVGFDRQSVNQFDRSGRTALWHVLSKPELSDDDNEIARILLDAGADAEMSDINGVSPREAAAASSAHALLERADLSQDITPPELDSDPGVAPSRKPGGPRL